MSRRRRGLTPEEQELWSRVAGTADALHPPRPKPQPEYKAPPKSAAPSSLVAKPQPPALPQFRVGQSVSLPTASGFHRNPSPAERLADTPLRMDHKTHKRMTQGRIRPQARLDLHGMTLAAAHPELIRFVLSCHANGLRLVLVITGKGRGDHGPLPTRPGALRHQVPIWLYQPPLSAVIQQIAPANYRHGGEGAYYVYLRK